MSFGENLTNLRRQKGWSQDDLANNLDLSRQAISKWENETSKPDIDNIKKISKIFSIKIDDLINNELPDDKAVTLDVKKEEKREKTITIIKLMIIAVIILYVISVIYKFASLLVIVNGVKKYANLNNYHYVITTYENNDRVEKKECWYKDGISKTLVISYENDTNIEKRQETCVDYNNSYGYIEQNEKKTQINVDEYLKTYVNYNYGSQLYSELPIELRNKNLFYLVNECVSNSFKIDNEENITLKLGNKILDIRKDNMLPQSFYSYDNKNNIATVKFYTIEFNSVSVVEI